MRKVMKGRIRRLCLKIIPGNLETKEGIDTMVKAMDTRIRRQRYLHPQSRVILENLLSGEDLEYSEEREKG